MFSFEDYEDILDMDTFLLQKAVSLDNAKPMDVTLTVQGEELGSIVEVLIAEITQQAEERGLRPHLMKRNLKCIIANLYRVWHVNKDKYVAYYRMKNTYKRNRYNAQKIGYVGVYLINRLNSLGYITNHLGYRDGATGRSRRSRMRASEKLATLFAAFKFRKGIIIRVEESETIILRTKTDDDKKMLLDYNDTNETCGMREFIRIYNSFMSNTDVSIHDDTSQCDIDFTNTGVVRIFTDHFSSGGRFYGGWWQNIPKHLRRYILLAGEETVELDYSGMHFVFLHAMKGYEFNVRREGDPYSLTKFPGAKIPRSLLKVVFNICLNTSSRHGAVMALCSHMREKVIEYSEVMHNYGAEKIVSMFSQQHDCIAEFFHTERGLFFQYVDACIAEDILGEMIDLRLPVLGIHDSFIVRKQDLDALHKLMCRSFHRHMLNKFSLDTRYAPHTKMVGLYTEEEWDRRNEKLYA